jgi:hypothetical protein
MVVTCVPVAVALRSDVAGVADEDHPGRGGLHYDDPLG